LLARPLAAQEAPGTLPSEDAARWTPLGPVPVDEAGAGRRGYVLALESAEVTAPGRHELSWHAVAANVFYREERGDVLISQRFDTHTVAFGYRRGFSVGKFRQLELGGQLQFTESDAGVLNRFIEGFENVWVSLTGNESARNNLRTNPAARPPLGS